MADIERSSEAIWHGNLRQGNGKVTASSGVLKDIPYTFATRFEQAPGTNPEELIAAAHSACFSMALSARLSGANYKVDHIQTRAVVHLTPQRPSGFKITKVSLYTHGKVEGIDEAKFKQEAEEAKKTCPVSQALAALELTVEAKLEK